jgi:polysaccharide biosynthesis/export protein
MTQTKGNRLHRMALVWCLAAASPLLAQATSAGQSSLVTSYDTASGKEKPETAPALQQRPRYLIKPGDALLLEFPLSTEFNQTLSVAPDGYVSLQGVGDLAVSGKSLPEIREALKKAYSGILHNPIVNVQLKDFQKPQFVVGGEVGHPGRFELREDTTVTEALAVAGGTTKSSKNSQVLLFRRMPGGSMVEVRKLNLNRMMKKGDLREDLHLQAGDMVFVPKNAFSKIERFIPSSSLGMYVPGIP